MTSANAERLRVQLATRFPELNPDVEQGVAYHDHTVVAFYQGYTYRFTRFRNFMLLDREQILQRADEARSGPR